MIEKAKTAEALGPRPVRAYSFWITAFLALFLYIAFVATPMDFSQLWQPYIMGRQMPYLKSHGILSWFLDEWNLVLLVIGALVFSKREDRKFFFIPFISVIFGILIFAAHRPIWFYHRFYVIIPMCWLASFGFYALSQQIRAGWEKRRESLNKKSVLVILFLYTAVVLYVFMLPSRYDLIKSQIRTASPEYRHVVSLMKQYNKQRHMIATDRPIFAFYADMPVFPYLVSSSGKRMYAGLLGEEDFLNAILKEKPEIILFARYPELHDKIAPYIQKDYELEYANPVAFQWLYVLRSVKEHR
jgi:signal transduction histidine kinase